VEQSMDPQVFEDWMMYILVSGLILFMAFIVWDLAKKSQAGRFGSMILFLALGLGVLGFIIKTVVIAGLEGI
jgi:ABC-type lipoprotein release transport system permease subunit